MTGSSVSVHVEGLKELDEALQKLQEHVLRDTLEAGLAAGGEVLREGMSTRAPEDTGVLRSSITYEVRLKGREIGVVVGPSTDAFYGGFVELGTRFMQPKPFMRRTAMEDGPAAVEAYAAAMRQALEALHVQPPVYKTAREARQAFAKSLPVKNPYVSPRVFRGGV